MTIKLTQIGRFNPGFTEEGGAEINAYDRISQRLFVVNGVENARVTSVELTSLNGQEAELRSRGVRIFPDKSFAEDAEPEFIAVSPDGTAAFFTLQENNAVAVVDIETAEVTEIQPLGVKDYSRGLPQIIRQD